MAGIAVLHGSHLAGVRPPCGREGGHKGRQPPGDAGHPEFCSKC